MLTSSQNQLLLNNIENNIGILCLAEDYPIAEIVQGNDMLMCSFDSIEKWCHFSHNSSAGFVADFLMHQKAGAYVVISDEIVFATVRDKFPVSWSIECYRLFLKREITTPELFDLHPLEEEHLPLVFQYSKYQQFLTQEYLHRQLALGGGFIKKVNDEQVAWVMSHDDGSLGMLQVLDAHKGKGYARQLIAAMAENISARGRPVFAHIEPKNTASIRLFESMGFEIIGKITWARIKK